MGEKYRNMSLFLQRKMESNYLVFQCGLKKLFSKMISPKACVLLIYFPPYLEIKQGKEKGDCRAFFFANKISKI